MIRRILQNINDPLVDDSFRIRNPSVALRRIKILSHGPLRIDRCRKIVLKPLLCTQACIVRQVGIDPFSMSGLVTAGSRGAAACSRKQQSSCKEKPGQFSMKASFHFYHFIHFIHFPSLLSFPHFPLTLQSPYLPPASIFS